LKQVGLKLDTHYYYKKNINISLEVKNDK